MIQSEAHPSPLTTFPSSQVSPLSMRLFPQLGKTQVWLTTVAGQLHAEPLYTNPSEQTVHEVLLLLLIEMAEHETHDLDN